MSDRVARLLGFVYYEFCFGRRVPVEEVVAKIDAVDATAVRRLGRSLLDGSRLSLAAVGPLDALPPIDLGR